MCSISRFVFVENIVENLTPLLTSEITHFAPFISASNLNALTLRERCSGLHTQVYTYLSIGDIHLKKRYLLLHPTFFFLHAFDFFQEILYRT